MFEMKKIKEITKIGGNLKASRLKPIHHQKASIQQQTTFLNPIIWWNIRSPEFCKKKQ
jgi:hypothetical protein